MSGHIGLRLHPERVPDERLGEIWDAVYEGYTERWDQEELERMADVGEEVCSALEELVELRAKVARVEALIPGWRQEASMTFSSGAYAAAARDLEAALKP